MAKKRELTPLEYVVLGLISLEPQSGYSIVSFFEGGEYIWSASPGSIYPILKRLEQQGVIEGNLELEHETRPRKIYTLTPVGEALLDEWLHEVPRMRPFYEQRELALLRFQFMAKRFTIRQTLEWLDKYLDVVKVADAYRQGYQEPVLAALMEMGKSFVYSQLLVESAMMEQNTLRMWLEMARARLAALALQTGEFEAVRGDDELPE